MRVLLIEHDARIRQNIKARLVAEGYFVTAAADGATAIDFLRTHAADVALVSLTLQDVDGLALLAAIRTARPRMAVIALTAGNDVQTRLDAFDKGADDCVPASLSSPELAARIRARLRWRDGTGTVVAAGPLSLDLATNRAVFDENSVSLSSRESSLLAAFLRHAGQVLSRDELLRLVWEIGFDPGSNVVDVYVAALRRKLGPHVIETVRGQGYRLRTSSLNGGPSEATTGVPSDGGQDGSGLSSR